MMDDKESDCTSSSSSASSSISSSDSSESSRHRMSAHLERTVSQEDILSKIMSKQGPYVNQLVEYFSNDTSSRFGLEILINQPTFFLSDADLLAQMNDRHEWQVIGRGSFGSVYKAVWMDVDVAVKVLHSKRQSRYSFDAAEAGGQDLITYKEEEDHSLYDGLVELFEEFELARRIRHPHIANFYIASPHMYVLEYMHGGTLSEYIRTHTAQQVDSGLKQQWSEHVSKAIKYLHQFQMVHSDISLDNIMLDQYLNCKLVDVGGAYIVADGAQPKFKIARDQFLPLHHNALTVEESHRSLGVTSDLYAVALVVLCIAAWEVDVYNMLGLHFFERTVCSSSDKACTVTEALRTATPAVCKILLCADWMPRAMKCKVLQDFAGNTELADEATSSFVQEAARYFCKND
jgi:Protein kinase domain